MSNSDLELSQSLLANELQKPAAVSMEASPYMAKGKHALATLALCRPELLNDETALLEITREAATASGATVLKMASHSFDPPGVTVVAVLAESHASLHTYPDAGLVFWDCFTCGDSCDPAKSVELLSRLLGAREVRKQIVERE